VNKLTKKTHLVIGTLASLPIMASTTGITGIIGILGSIAPDLDTKLGMKFHRTFTHGLFFLIFSSFGISVFSKNIAFIFR
jgi:membrane-bound metal-dependent hydrolase YbcI (DUF457 family)